jgi:hypothetical protein
MWIEADDYKYQPKSTFVTAFTRHRAAHVAIAIVDLPFLPRILDSDFTIIRDNGVLGHQNLVNLFRSGIKQSLHTSGMSAVTLPDLGDNDNLVDRTLFLFLGASPHGVFTHTLIGAVLQAGMWSILAFCVRLISDITNSCIGGNIRIPRDEKRMS